jgi:hypothetical protein
MLAMLAQHRLERSVFYMWILTGPKPLHTDPVHGAPIARIGFTDE